MNKKQVNDYNGDVCAMGEQETLKIFDEARNMIGEATRAEVHKYGYWHETFHCWFISNDQGIDYIYFQLRSDDKKDYPGLLDITSAGHLMADENVNDGVREIKEEIGIDVAFEELIVLGIMEYCAEKADFIDNELAHVFLYKSENTFDDFTLQADEVSGIVKARFTDFTELWFGTKDKIEVQGFAIDKNKNKLMVDQTVSREKFVPHQEIFYQEVIRKITEYIR
ncbi:NUDIX hydrolase [Fredinandcohnia sp. 179-A 10B2 NHS]|uniref:NUDIX hydrolase n=1 Tax=Fredinandcohnia sp. 179-A 10B2 NHS TaxID=3235176 RepID=UPI0039A1DEAC